MKLYDDLAGFWPLLSPPDDYAEEAAFYWRVMQAARAQPITTILELGSGGGNNASHLKRHASLTLVEPSEGMLAHSRLLNPESVHVRGDMRDVRLERAFDAVFIHDAIGYMTSESDLRQALETAAVHCAPGGVVLLCPDYVRETFEPGTEHGGTESDDVSFRYLEWVWDPDPTDNTFIADYIVAIRGHDGRLRVEHDRHIEGLFSRDTWLRLITEAGFEQVHALPLEHSEVEPGRHEVFVAVRCQKIHDGPQP